MSDAICRHLLIGGRVQGVGFRMNTLLQANQLGVHGWVRNLPDDRVEVLAWGERQAMDQFIEWCRRGPLHARVDAVEIFDGTSDPKLNGFVVR
ncbi:MAG: acylphosphatase [Caldilineaceae bacterium]|nr:acylphosphatase [Caldilineaceae bacterium]